MDSDAWRHHPVARVVRWQLIQARKPCHDLLWRSPASLSWSLLEKLLVAWSPIVRWSSLPGWVSGRFPGRFSTRGGGRPGPPGPPATRQTAAVRTAGISSSWVWICGVAGMVGMQGGPNAALRYVVPWSSRYWFFDVSRVSLGFRIKLSLVTHLGDDLVAFEDFQGTLQLIVFCQQPLRFLGILIQGVLSSPGRFSRTCFHVTG